MEAIWTLEERLWVGADYETSIDPSCVMAFPAPTGIMSGAIIVQALAAAPRWTSVEMDERHANAFRDDLMTMAYRATGLREGNPPYRAYCTSTYRRVEGAWRLIQHQQTPL